MGESYNSEYEVNMSGHKLSRRSQTSQDCLNGTLGFSGQISRCLNLSYHVPH